MNSVIYNSKAAISNTIVYYANSKATIRNTIVYAVALALAIGALVTPKSAVGYILVGIVVVWAIGGLTASVRAIYYGFAKRKRKSSER
jgi:hypothetical protein